MSNPLAELFDATLVIGGHSILWREIIGNAFGFASAIGGLKRRVWAWPVGIVGNLLLLTVFLGTVFHTPQATDLYGQAGRQIFFIVVSVYGWVRWRTKAQETELEHGAAIQPRWATMRERLLLIALGATGTVGFATLFMSVFNAYPAWAKADAWILTGSLLATYAMARGWTDFWLIWLTVDIVGVPLLLQNGLYPSALLYGAYGVLVIIGFLTWRRTHVHQQQKQA